MDFFGLMWGFLLLTVFSCLTSPSFGEFFMLRSSGEKRLLLWVAPLFREQIQRAFAAH